MLRPPIATVAFPMNGKLKINQSPGLSQNSQGYDGTENFMVSKGMIYWGVMLYFFFYYRIKTDIDVFWGNGVVGKYEYSLILTFHL